MLAAHRLCAVYSRFWILSKNIPIILGLKTAHTGKNGNALGTKVHQQTYGSLAKCARTLPHRSNNYNPVASEYVTQVRTAMTTTTND